VLGYADYSIPFVVETDASLEGLGAVLSQVQDGKKRVIAYASRCLRQTERNMENYSSMKLELLAMKWAITEKFRDYLMGHTFTVFTDNNPLSYLDTAKLGAIEQRWVAQLASFTFDVKYRSGKANANADSLSRKVCSRSSINTILSVVLGTTPMPEAEMRKVIASETEQTIPKVFTNSQIVITDTFPSYSKEELKEWQMTDTNIKRLSHYLHMDRKPTSKERQNESVEVQKLIRQWDRFKFDGCILYRHVQDTHQGELKQFVLQGFHKNVLSHS